MNTPFEIQYSETERILAEEAKARLAYEKKKRDAFLKCTRQGEGVTIAWQKAARDAEELERKFEEAQVKKLALWYTISATRSRNEPGLI